MSSPSRPGGRAARAVPSSLAPAGERESRHLLRKAFGVLLFVGWGILTVVWVASTVFLVVHGTVTAVITAVCAVALLLLLGGMEGLEVSVIDRWQKFWPGARESDLAGWLAARQLFVALIVTAATLLANRSVVIVPGTSIQFRNGFFLGVFDLLWTTLTVLWFAQIFWKHLGATNPDRYLGTLSGVLFPIVEVVRKVGISQPGEWTADFVESRLLWPASIEQLEQGKPDHPLTHGDIWRMIRSDRRKLAQARRGPARPGGPAPGRGSRGA
jgi:hypothetical protein